MISCSWEGGKGNFSRMHGGEVAIEAAAYCSSLFFIAWAWYGIALHQRLRGDRGIEKRIQW